MKTIGIVAEYNPFHLGHAWHIAESRRRLGGSEENTAVIAVMSGDFVQRGEAAAFSKYARAEAACRGGADLVVELPLPWSLSSAEHFAEGAVGLLAELGVQTLSFGSESADLDTLKEISAVLAEPEFQEEIRERLRREPAMSYAGARQKLAEERMGRNLPQMNSPNDILALEYLRAVRKRNLSLETEAVPRQGAGHDREEETEILSALELRKRLARGADITAYLPESSAEIIGRERTAGRMTVDRNRENLLMLSRLRSLREETFEMLPDAGNGLGKRLYETVRKAGSYEEILRSVPTRRYPLSRVRRLCFCAALDIGESSRPGNVPYARVLALNGIGRQYLREAAQNTQVPILTRPASVHGLGRNAEYVFDLTARAHDFYTLFYADGAERPCGEDWRKGPVICS